MPFSPAVAFVLVTAVGVVAALAASRAGRTRAYACSKAAASAGFIGVALAVGATGATWSRFALGALVVAAVGDVALAARGRTWFLAGIACFAAAHGLYVVAFLVYGSGYTTMFGTVAVAAMVAGGAWLWLGGRLPDRMRAPVHAYIAVVATMMATGTAAGITHRSWMLVCGVVLVAGSDLAVGRERFRAPTFADKLAGLAAYYAGQTLIALSLAGP